MSEFHIPIPASIDPAPSRVRLTEIDFFRGLVIVLMTLDHTRDFFTHLKFEATDLSQTYPALFVTRWITHFCAPSFVFLAGVAAFFASQRRSQGEFFRFLMTRGLWLAFLELTVVRYGWYFVWRWDYYYLGVIWAIGWSMVSLALLFWLPQRMLLILSLIIILFHNLLDGFRVVPAGWMEKFWMILHQSGEFKIAEGVAVGVGYPWIPWIAVLSLGFCLGPLFQGDPARKRKIFTLLGWGALLLFVLLRVGNFYGDPVPWIGQKTALLAFFSFINCTKYPPSLDYLLMTLGPLFLCFGNWKPLPVRLESFFVTFGKVPLFYYLIHLYVIEVLGRAWVYFQTGGKTVFEERADGPLIWVYVFWWVTILLLYPVCNWFVGVKKRNRHWWLGYL